MIYDIGIYLYTVYRDAVYIKSIININCPLLFVILIRLKMYSRLNKIVEYNILKQEIL